MTKHVLLAAVASASLLAGCQLTPQDRSNIGLLGGAAAGVLTAQALDANEEWTILAGVAGAAAGTLYARNTATGNCAYSNGDGTYTVRPC
ncbi:glucose-6-phosphate isomerase [Rhodobacterales bacterium HKCCE2091]|nr:glucose-6-phosphate isomerase [Rhodobacterales bacterium HKCCE2091]